MLSLIANISRPLYTLIVTVKYMGRGEHAQLFVKHVATPLHGQFY